MIIFLVREFEEKNFMRVNFGKNVPNVIVKKVLNKGLLLKDPFNTTTSMVHYRFCAHSPSQLRNRSCIFVNFDADFWSVKFPELQNLVHIKKRTERHKLIKGRGFEVFFDSLIMLKPSAKFQLAFQKYEIFFKTPKKPTYIYNYFGTFDQKVVAKYAARVGLLLSPTAQHIFIPDGRWGREEVVL